MIRNLFKQNICILIFILISTVSTAQSFEGWITYKMEALNPNKEMFPDSLWHQILKEQFGESESITQKYFYKNDKYVSEIKSEKVNGFQAFDNNNKLIYSWALNSDTAITLDTRKYLDELIEIVDNENTETILGIVCKSIIVKSKLGQMTIWYNKDYFKIDAALFKGHKYGHWESILQKIGCLPLKMEQKGLMTHLVQTAIDFKEETINDNQFVIPKFNTVIENPVN